MYGVRAKGLDLIQRSFANGIAAVKQQVVILEDRELRTAPKGRRADHADHRSRRDCQERDLPWRGHADRTRVLCAGCVRRLLSSVKKVDTATMPIRPRPDRTCRRGVRG